jgi:hypothetical protein
MASVKGNELGEEESRSSEEWSCVEVEEFDAL